ncbi:MAG: DUF456 domain-containing protein [Opitutales bacterium]
MLSPETWALLVAGGLVVIGLLSNLLPILPGQVIIFAGMVVHKVWLGEASVSWTYLAWMAGLTVLGLVADYLFAMWGAKRFGATWRGSLGALLGMAIGLFIPPPLFWLILGPIVGAIVAELLGGRAWKEAERAGLGTLLGALVALAVKLALSVIMAVTFFWQVW